MAGAFETVIGLEVHSQLLTQSKLFCGCPARFGAQANEHVCPVCLGLPGALPVPNGAAVDMAMRAALALGCQVRTQSVFERKNYFYPDLAKGYQISQFALPLSEHGELSVEVDGATRTVSIVRIHMEEDAAKNIHGVGSGTDTLVDFNRAGVPLIEIVSGPDLRSAAEAEAYLRRLREVLMFCGVNDGNLEEGSFRCDANVSIRPVGQQQLGTRTELKNINSFRFVRKAIEYEVSRQKAVVSGGGTIVQETRTWLESSATTVSMRSKEEAMDYRYFPDPDLPPLQVDEARVDAVRAALPELPVDKRARYVATMGLTESDAGVMTGHPEIACYFEGVVSELCKQLGNGAKLASVGKRVANFIQSEALRYVQTEGLAASLPGAPEALAELLALVEDGTVSGKMAKSVFSDMVQSGRSARALVDEKGLSQVSDAGQLESVIRDVLASSPDNVAAYRGGKTGLLGWFVGQVMKATKGAANPKLANELLRKLLDEEA
ncbi:MAG: Asp-tRNA(Asn)/Glu-tRNA(Gln) amidotransferase subunit GatB [Myxococcales bacterium]|nr:Asp-tRNA(Asn)/Glu-tRNA(Gln) amidotransferase subunit GatB [Myxococcales bacterium]MDD9969884.1 Asp-tRNA(Asn)/Glu-tRNA(Gln) amidotransferase subunit GatB [Myxococcales bacterium]